MKNSVKIFARGAGLLVLFLTVIACDEQVASERHSNTAPPTEIISVRQAKQMFDSYTDRRVPIIKQFEETEDSSNVFHPTRFGSYSYETIKNYMDFIEAEAALANVEIGELRFYLTNYPATTTFEDGVAVRYPGQNSFMIVPTTEVDGKQQGFITRVQSDGGRTIVLIKDWLQEQSATKATIIKESDGAKPLATVTNETYLGSLKPQLLMINPYTGSASSVQRGGDVSLILNESNLRPPPPNPDTDFD